MMKFTEAKMGRFLDVAGIALCSFLVYWAWVMVVDPFPDRDTVNQYFYPFLNYLKASTLLENSFNFLVENVFISAYPHGGALFPWLISALGLQSVFLENPFLLSLALILILAVIPLFFKLDRLQRWTLGLLIFFLPMTQILLKGFSLQAHNVIFTLVAMLFMRSYLLKDKKLDLLGFVFFFWLAVIMRHLGAFYLANFLAAYALWCAFRLRLDWRIPLCVFGIILASLPFYPLKNLESYLVHVITHNESLSVMSFFVILTAIMVSGVLWLFLIHRFSKKEVLPKGLKNPIFLALSVLFATYLTTIAYDSDIGNRDVLLFLIFGYGGMAFLFWRYRFDSVRGFLIIFILLTYVNSTLLFSSMIGKTYHSFFLPIALILILGYVESPRGWTPRVLLLTCFFLSNFFPGIKTLGAWFGQRGENIYINGFNAPYVNPLGWESCEIPTLRSALVKLYSAVDLGDLSNLYITKRIHFHTKLALEFPHNFFYPFPSIFRLDNLPPDRLQNLLKQYQNQGDKMFEIWLSQAKVPILILGKRPFTGLVGDPPPMEEVLSFEEPDLNDFSRALGFRFVDHLETSGRLATNYRCSSLPEKKPRIEVCLLKGLKKVSPQPEVWNQSLADVATLYELGSSRKTIPPWVKFLPPENRVRFLKKQAGTLYEKAQMEQEAGKASKTYLLLREALNLDPLHQGALEDVFPLQDALNDANWREISPKFMPLKAQSLERSFFLTSSFPQGLGLRSPVYQLLAKERAHQLFILSNRYFNGDLEHCVSLLLKVLELDPGHEEARKDLKFVSEKLKRQKNERKKL
jgi:hypothetical protein